LPFVVIPNERSEEESLFTRQFQQPHCNPPRLLGGWSLKSLCGNYSAGSFSG
jgi:hypothetical protein